MNYKTLIKLSIYYIINLLIRPSKKIKLNSLVLIRLDGIGDYILFRNFIETLRKSQKYKNYSITLIGNVDWKNLTEELDYKFIDNFIWIDRNIFSKNLIYRYKKLKEIASNGHEVIINPIFSRRFFLDDNIVKLIYAKEKIGSVSNTSNIEKWQKNISDKYYTRLIHTQKEITFEFYRNRFFFECLLETKLDIDKPNIFIKNKDSELSLSKKYAILFIGANNKYRQWGIKKFAKIGNYLYQKHGYRIVICGSLKDSNEAKELEKHLIGNTVNLVGKTSLVELLKIISMGDLILSNETSAPHIAVALNIKNIFVIYNGQYFGRFIPYPKQISKFYHAIYHPFIESNLDEYKILSNSHDFMSDLDINEISSEMVKVKIESSLKNQLEVRN